MDGGEVDESNGLDTLDRCGQPTNGLADWTQLSDYWVKVPALVVPTPGQQEVSALLVRPAFTLHLPYILPPSTKQKTVS